MSVVAVEKIEKYKTLDEKIETYQKLAKKVSKKFSPDIRNIIFWSRKSKPKSRRRPGKNFGITPRAD